MSEKYLDPAISEIGYLVGDISRACGRFAELYEIQEWQEARYTDSGKRSMRLYRYQPEQGLCFSLYEAGQELWSPCRNPNRQSLHHICHEAPDFGEACAIALRNGLYKFSEGVIESDSGTCPSAFFYDGALTAVIQILERKDSAKPAVSIPNTILGKIGIGHIGYLTADREVTLAHLERLYGLGEWLRVEYKPQKAWCYGKPTQGQYYVKAAVIPGATGCSWEINQAVTGGTHRDYLESWPNRINHICHKIQDFEYWRDHFVRLGCTEKFAAEMEDDIMGYRRCFYAYDTVLDTIFELMEKPHFRR